MLWFSILENCSALNWNKFLADNVCGRVGTEYSWSEGFQLLSYRYSLSVKPFPKVSLFNCLNGHSSRRTRSMDRYRHINPLGCWSLSGGQEHLYPPGVFTQLNWHKNEYLLHSSISLQVFLSACNMKPYWHEHLKLPGKFSHLWLQPPFDFAHSFSSTQIFCLSITNPLGHSQVCPPIVLRHLEGKGHVPGYNAHSFISTQVLRSLLRRNPRLHEQK